VILKEILFLLMLWRHPERASLRVYDKIFKKCKLKESVNAARKGSKEEWVNFILYDQSVLLRCIQLT
jgi:hypothetical protein